MDYNLEMLRHSTTAPYIIAVGVYETYTVILTVYVIIMHTRLMCAIVQVSVAPTLYQVQSSTNQEQFSCKPSIKN